MLNRILNMNPYHYNAFVALIGAACLAHTWWEFFGIIAIVESIQVTIEAANGES